LTAVRIGFDTTALSVNSAGEARYAAGLRQALRGHPGVALEQLTLSPRVPEGMRQRLAYQGLSEGLWYPFLLARQARGVDLVHFTRPVAPPALGLRAPSVVTVHDVLALSMPQHFSTLIARRFRVLAGVTTSNATRVITGSEHSRRELSEHLGVPLDRIVVTPYGIERRFRPAPPGPDWLARRFGIDRPYVLCVGTLEPRKNLPGVLAAFEAMHGFDGDVALVVVGGRGWKTAAIDEAVSRSTTHLVVAGRVSDEELVRLYSGAACFLFPSFAEGFGFPVLEAMACGAPVVTSDRSSLPEVAGDAAVLVDPESAEAIGAGLAEVLGSPERQAELRRRGLERSSRFSWEATAEATVGVYREALAA
jgi:glycosyltransferase involved in cell wall biosynthesis